MVLKMHIFYLKLQTKDHFWSPSHSEVVLPVILLLRNKRMLYCDLAAKSNLSSRLLESILFLLILILFCCVFPDFQDSSQIGLLKELLDLQKDMVVMLLSLLEGRMSVSGTLPTRSPPLFLPVTHVLLLPFVFRQRGEWHHCQANG